MHASFSNHAELTGHVRCKMDIYFYYFQYKIRVIISFSETTVINYFMVQNCHRNFPGEWQMGQLSFTCLFPKVVLVEVNLISKMGIC